MSLQHQKWIQIVKDKLNSEGMTQTHLARACGVKKPTISELLKYGKGSNKLKNRVCDVLGIDESWVDLGEQDRQIKTATVKMFKERPNGDLSEFIIELIIPSRRRYGAVIREYIEYYNAKHFAKIYFYEVLELEISKNQKGEQYERNF